MNFYKLLLIIKVRKLLITSIITIFFIIGLAISLVLPKTYTATTSLVVNYKGIDPLTGVAIPSQLMPGYMATQIDIITSHSVALRVVETLKLNEIDFIKKQYQSSSSNVKLEDWLSDLILKGVSVKPSKESSILQISYNGRDPNFSATMANAFAEAYQDASLRLKSEPSRKAADYLLKQSSTLRNNLEKAQSKLSEYQEESGITSFTENFDVENSKLNQLANQLIAAQAQALESSNRHLNADLRGDASPDVSSNPVIQNLKITISQTSSKLAEVENKYGKNHPQYLSLKAELDKAKTQLDLEVQRIGTSVEGSAYIYKQNETKLKAALAAQKDKVLKLNRLRDQIAVLQRDVESAQLAYNSVMQRLNQTTLEGKASESDISVLNTAIPPSESSSPRLLLNLVVALFLGIVTSLFFAVFIELKTQIIRTSHDVLEATELPVLVTL